MPSPAKESANPFSALTKIREVAPNEGGKKLGRPVKADAKSRDKDYRAWTGYLKTAEVAEADYLLKVSDKPRGMSDLLGDLLADWIAQEKKRRLNNETHK